MKLVFSNRLLLLACLLISAPANSEFNLDEYKKAYPDQLDPFTGNWAGQWVEAGMDDPEISAQIYPLGDEVYRINFMHRYEVRCPILHAVDQKRSGDTLEFKNDTFYGRVEGNVLSGGNVKDGKRFELRKVVDESPTMGAKPPRDAIVLFNGKGMGGFRETTGWDVTEWGTLVVSPGSTDLVTTERYRDVQLHLEFRLPYRPTKRGQDRGNSGVHLQGAYEVQILDSFGLEGVYNECGSLYKVAAPKVNMCRPPLQWHTFDVTYTGPRHSEKGDMESMGRMTVYHNGVLVHHEVDLPWRTGGGPMHKNRHPENHPLQAQSIKLQEHEDFAEFRNIWIVDLEHDESAK